jgi:hypothetical protein
VAGRDPGKLFQALLRQRVVFPRTQTGLGN